MKHMHSLYKTDQQVEKNPMLHNVTRGIHSVLLLKYLACPEGFEPPTYWFVASHSIQLSYRRVPRFLNATL